MYFKFFQGAKAFYFQLTRLKWSLSNPYWEWQVTSVLRRFRRPVSQSVL